MTESPRARIETQHLILVEATIPMLIADQAWTASSQRRLELMREFVQRKISADEHHTLVSPLLESMSDFGRLLDADIFGAWPPPLDHLETRQQMISYLKSNPEPGWGMWYVLLKRNESKRAMAVGNVSFKGPRSDEGIVEIDYPWFAGAFQVMNTPGAEAVQGLVTRALEDPRVQRVIAEIPEDKLASLGVTPTSSEYFFSVQISALEKNGFQRAGTGSKLLFQRDRVAPGLR